MMSQDCIFCKIIEQKIPASVIANTDDVLVIKDIAPKAPIHYLIIPKKHVPTISALEASDKDIPSIMTLMAQQLSKQLSGSQSFRYVINNGPDAGQTVYHLHAHFLAGKKMTDAHL